MDIKKLINDTVTSTSMDQDPDELFVLLHLLVDRNPKVILEIGTGMGGATKLWAEFLTELGGEFKDKKVITIDPVAHVTRWDAKESKVPVEFITGYSHETFKQVCNAVQLGTRKVDFLFIDGDHFFEAVSRDFALYETLVRPNGIIALHDAGSNGNGPFDFIKAGAWKGSCVHAGTVYGRMGMAILVKV